MLEPSDRIETLVWPGFHMIAAMLNRRINGDDVVPR